MQLLSAGYDGMDLEKLRVMGIPLATNGGANALLAVAEHTIMMILSVYRQLVDVDKLVRSGGWKAAAMGEEAAHELEGKTVGIIGAGNIGKAVARRLQGWDVNLLYADPIELSVEEEQRLQLEHVDLDTLLKRSDVITLHARADDSTREMINGRTLGLMKPDAILINCARGELVDEAALHRALTSGQIAAAGWTRLRASHPSAKSPAEICPTSS